MKTFILNYHTFGPVAQNEVLFKYFSSELLCRGSVVREQFLQRTASPRLLVGFKLVGKPSSMLRLHIVLGGHGNPISGHRGQNGVTVAQRRGTAWTNVACHGCRGR